MRNLLFLSALAVIALCSISCQKEDNATPTNELVGKKKESVEITGLLKSINMQDKQENLPFTIFCAGVSGENVDIGLVYNRTEQVRRFSAIWDGKYEIKDDSTFVNLMLVRENSGVLLKDGVRFDIRQSLPNWHTNRKTLST